MRCCPVVAARLDSLVALDDGLVVSQSKRLIRITEQVLEWFLFYQDLPVGFSLPGNKFKDSAVVACLKEWLRLHHASAPSSWLGGGHEKSWPPRPISSPHHEQWENETFIVTWHFSCHVSDSGYVVFTRIVFVNSCLTLFNYKTVVIFGCWLRIKSVYTTDKFSYQVMKWRLSRTYSYHWLKYKRLWYSHCTHNDSPSKKLEIEGFRNPSHVTV